MKSQIKKAAINMRKNGFSYSEILKEIPVAKSTLSLWLRSVQLAKIQKQRLTKKKLAAMQRGWETRRQQRIDSTFLIKQNAYQEITAISQHELFLMGVMLYWAEGSKSKQHNISQGIIFSNSDAYMNKIFLLWLKKCIKITIERITFDIYIHESSHDRLSKVKKYWASKTGFPLSNFDKIYLKKDKTNTKRKNVGNEYYGLLRIKVKKSTNLNRRISAWIEAIIDKCGVV